MNHTSSLPLDAEAYRYLKHHALLERAREVAYTHLNQIWIQLNRLITRELGSDFLENNWLEVISSESDQMIGIRWSTASIEGGVTLEVADVRRWTHTSGERVVFTISSPHAATRQRLKRRLSHASLDRAFKLGDALSHSVLSYSAESSRVISVALPLMLGEPRHEAGAILESIAMMWELMEGDRDADESPPRHADESPPRHAESSPASPQRSTQQRSTQQRSTQQRSIQERGDETLAATTPPRYASAAPPPQSVSRRAQSSQHLSQEFEEAQPFPPTLPPVPLEAPTSSAQGSSSTDIPALEPSSTPPMTFDPSGDLSKEEMIQLVQTQARQRSGRLIRGGERNAAPVLSEPPRFVPRPLSDHEARERSIPSRGRDSNTESSTVDEGRVYAPTAEAETISLTAEARRVSDDLGQLEVEATPQNLISQPIDIQQGAHSESADDVLPPSYIKPLHDQVAINLPDSERDGGAEGHSTHLTSAEQQITEGAHESDQESVAPTKLTLESLTELLERISLTPWRINTYDEGRGQILWLQNGSHLDYNPAGDLILGGENQDETRGRLSLVGIEV